MPYEKVVYVLKGDHGVIFNNVLLFVSKDMVNHRCSNKISQFLLGNIAYTGTVGCWPFVIRNIVLVC